MKSGVFGTLEGKDEKVSVGQEVTQRMNWISLMKQQFFITHTFRQNEILDSSNSVSASHDRLLFHEIYVTNCYRVLSQMLTWEFNTSP